MSAKVYSEKSAYEEVRLSLHCAATVTPPPEIGEGTSPVIERSPTYGD